MLRKARALAFCIKFGTELKFSILRNDPEVYIVKPKFLTGYTLLTIETDWV